MAVQDALGGSTDAVRIKLGDEDIKTIVESYEVKISILQIPSAFSLRLGWSDIAVDLLNKAKPGTPFELSVGPRLLQTGRIDARAVPTAQSTTVEIRGRDYAAVLLDAFVENEQSFSQKDYLSLTRKVMDLAGLTADKGHTIAETNDNARKLLTGGAITANQDSELASVIETGALGGTGNLVFQTPKTKVGERYFDFLQRQYKLAGLFLWATPDKTFVLAAPNSRQPATYAIYRARGANGAASNEASNVLDCRFNDDTTMRHSEVTVFGRTGGKNGVENCVGTSVDEEIVNNYQLDKRIVIHDADVKNKAQCEFVARRIMSEERRAGWQLEYTVAGHTIPSSYASDGIATWGPDTIVQVEDEELGIHGPFYLEACCYMRSSAGTTTKLTLMRTTDLLFATGLDGPGGTILQRKLKVPRGKTVR